jgi:HSP20 family protein
MPENVPKPLTPSTFTPFGGEFDRLFDRMVRAWSFGWLEPAVPGANGQPRALRTFEHAPKVEVQENGKTYTISIELPGLDQKDVKVLIEGDLLTISGEKHVERSDEKIHYTERSYGSFTRAFTLPSDADRDGISADFAKGVLTLVIPKAVHGSERAKQVEIKPH